MPILPWIENEVLFEITKDLLEKAKQAQEVANTQFEKNVIDPFSALFEITGFEIDYHTWHKNETTRKAQKTLQNHIGEFHQSILGACKEWYNLKTGNVVDLSSEKFETIAEIKNKYNTISGGKLSDLYYSLEELVMPKSSIYKGYTACYVSIIPKSPQRFNIPFTPSDKNTGTKCPANEKIRMIDGPSFYALVTGQDNALKNLYEKLPEVIQQLDYKKLNTVEIKRLSEFFSAAFG